MIRSKPLLIALSAAAVVALGLLGARLAGGADLIPGTVIERTLGLDALSRTTSHSSAAMTDTSVTYSFDLQGHRGARGLYPENTIPAFRRALEIGVHTLEMDLVITADSQVVVSHEPWFSRQICQLPSGEPIPRGRQKQHRIYEMTYEEVARYDCGSRGHRRFPEQMKVEAVKPLLTQVIDTAEAYVDRHDRPPIRYNLETKSQPKWDGTFHPPPERFTELVLEVLREKGVTDRATLQSFDPRTLRVAREREPELALSLLIGRSLRPGLQRHVDRLGFTPDVFSPYYQWVSTRRVEQAHEMGMEVIPWTVNETHAMRNLLEMGVDGIITDYPNRAVELLK